MHSLDVFLEIVLHFGFKGAKLTFVGIVYSMSQHMNLHLGLFLHFRAANVAFVRTAVRMLQIMTSQMTPVNIGGGVN